MPIINAEEDIEASGTGLYPPKYEGADTVYSPLYIKGLYSIVLYLGLGYLLLRRWDLLLLIFGVVLLHEAGHFIAMKYYNYTDVGILFLPFIGAWVQGSKSEISQRQSAVILLAGPVPGILLGIIFYFTDANSNIYIGTIPLQFIAQLLIWANLLNLLPFYPLDGGQLLNRVFFNEDARLTNIFIIISAIITIWVAISTGFYILLVIPALLVYRLINTQRNTNLEKAIEQTGIDVNTTYENLSDENYWKIRTVLISHLPSLHHINAGPPYSYDSSESKVAQMVEAVLQKNLLIDISVKGKVVLIMIWAFFIAIPWLFDIDFLLLKYLVR